MPIVRKKGAKKGIVVKKKPNYPKGKTLKIKKSYLTKTTMMLGKMLSPAKKRTMKKMEGAVKSLVGKIGGKGIKGGLRGGAMAMEVMAKGGGNTAKRKGLSRMMGAYKG